MFSIPSRPVVTDFAFLIGKTAYGSNSSTLFDYFSAIALRFSKPCAKSLPII